MDRNELNPIAEIVFIEKIGREELYEEVEAYKEGKAGYPKYLKAVRVCLMVLGYDHAWAEGEFRAMLEARYLTGVVD